MQKTQSQTDITPELTPEMTPEMTPTSDPSLLPTTSSKRSFNNPLEDTGEIVGSFQTQQPDLKT
jgi:hypothetical protein